VTRFELSLVNWTLFEMTVVKREDDASPLKVCICILEHARNHQTFVLDLLVPLEIVHIIHHNVINRECRHISFTHSMVKVPSRRFCALSSLANLKRIWCKLDNLRCMRFRWLCPLVQSYRQKATIWWTQKDTISWVLAFIWAYRELIYGRATNRVCTVDNTDDLSVIIFWFRDEYDLIIINQV